MRALKHPHTYQRIKGNKDIYRCIHPDCSHTAHRDMLLGKRCTCVCGEEYFMSREMLRLRNPHCEDCTKGRKRIISPRIISDILKDAGITPPELLRPTNKFEGDFGGEV